MRPISVSKSAAAWAVLVALGCSGSASSEAPIGATPAAAQDMFGETVTGDLPPGFGTLKQDAITIPMTYEGLAIKVTPLREWVIRMTAPDTYRRLSGYKTSMRAEIEEIARKRGDSGWPQVVLVSLFTRTPQQIFEPMELQILNTNIVFRPLGFIPITPEFAKGRINQNRTELAIYVFPSEIDLNLQTLVRYREARGGAWESIRQRLDRERALVRSRVGASGTTGGGG